MFTPKNLLIAGTLLIGLIVLKMMGLTLGDLWQMAAGEYESKREEMREYRATEYTAPLSGALRSEASKMGGETSAGIDGDLRRELDDERKRQMEENARNAERIGNQVLRGDVEVIKRSARENAARAAGNH